MVKERFGGGDTPYEAHLEARRDAIRRTMKGEFMRRCYNPNFKPGTFVPDRAMLRFSATQFTSGEYHYPTIKNFAKFCLGYLLPIGGLMYLFIKDNNEKERRYRSGQVAYDSDERYYNRSYY